MNTTEIDITARRKSAEVFRHFAAGQTEVKLTLPAGQHTFQLVLGDHQHIPHNPLIASDVITITVK